MSGTVSGFAVSAPDEEIVLPAIDLALVDQPAVTDAVILLEAQATDGEFTVTEGGDAVSDFGVSAPSLAIAGGAVTFRLSDRDWTSAPGDTLPSAHFEGRLGGFSIDHALPLRPDGARRVSAAIANLTIDNADGAWDGPARDLAVDGQPLVVSLLRHRSAAYADRVTMFRGLGLDWVPDGATNRLRLRARDLTYVLDRPMLPLYGGTGGADGGADLAGKPIPEIWGLCRGVSLVLEDAALLIYRVHARDVQAIAAVEVRGQPITAGTMRLSRAVMAVTTPTAGTWDWTITTDGSWVRLGSSPDGSVTADVQGDASAGYSSTLAGIMARILDRAGVAHDASAFAAGEAAAPGAAGIAFGADEAQVTYAEALSRLAGGGAFWWGDSGAGLVTMGRVALAQDAGGLLVDQTVIVDEVVPLDPLAVAWRVTVRYRRNWTPLSGTDIVSAPAITEARRLELQQPSRSVAVAEPQRRARNTQALDLVVDSLLDVESDAHGLGLNILSLLRAGPMLYRVPLGLAGHAIPLGAQVRLAWPRYGLAAGRDVRVVGRTLLGSRVNLLVLG